MCATHENGHPQFRGPFLANVGTKNCLYLSGLGQSGNLSANIFGTKQPVNKWKCHYKTPKGPYILLKFGALWYTNG